MPWCEPCSRYFSPNSVEDDHCPECGAELEAGEVAESAAAAEEARSAAGRVPWHFWLLLAALVAYLGWRAIQALDWALG